MRSWRRSPTRCASCRRQPPPDSRPAASPPAAISLAGSPPPLGAPRLDRAVAVLVAAPQRTAAGDAMPERIQDQPESTIGRKPEHHEEQPGTGGATRSGSALRREEGDEGEAAAEIREREQDELPPGELDE